MGNKRHFKTKQQSSYWSHAEFDHFTACIRNNLFFEFKFFALFYNDNALILQDK